MGSPATGTFSGRRWKDVLGLPPKFVHGAASFELLSGFSSKAVHTLPTSRADKSCSRQLAVFAPLIQGGEYYSWR